MNAELKKLFDRCPWKAKHYNLLPKSMADIRYGWREDEADFARLFLETGVMHEKTAAVERSLYLGRDARGAWILCVLEKTQSDYDVKSMAEGICSLMASGSDFKLPEGVLCPQDK